MSYQENLKVIEITKQQLTQVEQQFNQLQLKRNSQLAEIISDLTGIPHISTNIGAESTTVYIHYAQNDPDNKWRTHDISIYHRRPYKSDYSGLEKEYQFELSWFSTSFKFDQPEAAGYVDYLNTLGLLANSINNNGTIKAFILETIELVKPLRKESQELHNIIRNNEQANQTLINNTKRFDVQQAINRAEVEPIVFVPELKEYTDAKTYYFGRRDNVRFTAVRITKRTKKMTHFELQTVYNQYAKDEAGNYIMDENNNYTYQLTNLFNGRTAKLRHDDFESFVSQNWPKTFDDYKAEVEAKLIQD